MFPLIPAGFGAYVSTFDHDLQLLYCATNRFKKRLKAHLFHIAFWTIFSAPGQFVSRALQIPICICIICIRAVSVTVLDLVKHFLCHSVLLNLHVQINHCLKYYLVIL